MSRLVFIGIVLGFFISLEWYCYTGLALAFGNHPLFTYSYWSLTILIFLGFFKAFVDFNRKSFKIRSSFTNWLLGFGFSVIIAKIVFLGLLVFQDITRLVIGLCYEIAHFFGDYPDGIPGRSSLVTMISAILASIPLVSMIYGISCGKYNYKVEKTKLTFPDLPLSFDGFKIIQISDIHAGSFDSLEQVKRGVELISAQKADLIVFTGDLVNSMKEEIDPFLDIFSILEAPYGMYSILGNHDYYGMYQVAKNDAYARKLYMDDFNRKHERIGFRLLNNQNIKIVRGDESIHLIGVENWGSGPFPKKGDLNLALQGVNHDEFSILLSHDPTHWDHHVLPHPKKIHLTLSGHTHGMQFGINLGNFKWSPVKYRYKRWMGLYEEASQFLYVNRGFGFLGWPGRVGMSPEITLIELHSTYQK